MSHSRAKFGNVMSFPQPFGYENVVWQDNKPHGISRQWPHSSDGPIFTRSERTSMHEVIYPSMVKQHVSIDDHENVLGPGNINVDERFVDPSLFNSNPNYLGKRNYEFLHDSILTSKFI